MVYLLNQTQPLQKRTQVYQKYCAAMHNIQEILQNLGYKLKDCGAYWQTNALYRGGDNPTALQIYKDSGVWKDFVEDTMYLPIDALIEQTIGCKDSVEVKKYLSNARNLINKTHLKLN